MAPHNEAAWLPAEKVRPLQVGPAPYTPAGPGQLVVQNAAVAINPVQCYKQLLGNALLSYIRYPCILGGDVAGTVVEVGPGVQRFRPGDRVVAAALAIAEASNDPAEGAFQHYTVVREHMAAPLPANIPFERACVLPLALSTAAYGLFHNEFLALDMPTTTTVTRNDSDRRTVLITGGASSVGANAVQLAAAAGYDVVSTSSPKNFAYVKTLGAREVLDYHSDKLVEGLLAAVHGRVLAGAYAIGEGSVEACAAVLGRHEEVEKKLVASAMPVGGDFGGRSCCPSFSPCRD
jgi:NADPH:quinone reductase-like Zn-dependent oxidoreductase